MILYHGSNQEILTIDLSKSRPHKDFGQGFYLTENKEQAQKMAEQKVIQYGGIPTVNTYEFDEVNLNNPALRIKIFEGYTQEWAEFILANRNRENTDKVHEYDIVIGPITISYSCILSIFSRFLFARINSAHSCVYPSNILILNAGLFRLTSSNS